MVVFDDGPQVVMLREDGDALHVQHALAYLRHRTVGEHILEVNKGDTLAQPVQ